MDDRNAAAAFAALSHSMRLDLFRTLCRVFPARIASGDLARQYSVSPSTMTGHLQSLERAGLVRSQRHSRHVLYGANAAGTKRLVSALLHHVLGDNCDLTGCDRPAGRGSREDAAEDSPVTALLGRR